MADAEALLRAAEAAQDTQSASAAVMSFHAALGHAPAGSVDWAETQTRLSVALRLLGALVDDPAMLRDVSFCITGCKRER